jgi:putative membrane protein
MKYLKRLITEDGLPLTYVVFYAVGLALYIIPFTRELFVLITPYTLVLVAASAFLFHKEWNRKTVVVLCSIFVISMLVEIIGVATGKLFGFYYYYASLGISIARVPIIIGINWIILIYASNAILSKITTNKILKVSGASALMVIYDVVLEQAAPLMNMWKFENDVPPIRNYIMWFLMAVLFQSLIELFRVNTNNKPARALFIIQIFFFLIIVIYGLFFIR